MAKLRLLLKVVVGSLSILAVFALNLYNTKYHEAQMKNQQQDEDLKEWIGTVAGNLSDRRKRWYKIIAQSQAKIERSRVPDIIGIGVRKCGTGMLQNFIQYHPSVRIKLNEVHYYDQMMNMGVEHYKTLLPTATDDQLIMEKTPAYFTTHPNDLPQIILRDSPNVKLLLILCDPVHRAFSDYVMRRLHGSKKAASKTFEEYIQTYLYPVMTLFKNLTMQDDENTLEYVLKALRKDRCTFSFGHGIYAYFIRRWLRVFSPDQIMVINGEKFLTDPGMVIEKVQAYLEIPKLFTIRDFVRHPNTNLFCLRPWWNETYDFESEYSLSDDWASDLLCSVKSKGLTRSRNSKHTLSRESENELRKFYAPYNKILYNLLQQNFDW